ncbi:MAG: hypothetical protein MJE77_45115 [Proteobacteria bacterium]|nr:hypothetical protein [Pseudomonadota bacterium]
MSGRRISLARDDEYFRAMAVSGVVTTKTDREMEDQMLAVADDPERVDVLAKARRFKRTWLELAESLSGVYERESWVRWGFDSFEEYCRKELHIKKGTVAKLLGSFRFLKSTAPTVLDRSLREPSAPVPSLQAVDFIARATERGAADEDTMEEMKRAAFDDGADGAVLSRRFKEAAFPVDEGERREKLRTQLVSSARRLATLIAEPDAPVSHDIAVTVEESLGQLLDALDAVN